MSGITVRVTVAFPDGRTVDISGPVPNVSGYGGEELAPGSTEIAQALGGASASAMRAIAPGVYVEDTLKALREAVR